MYALRTISLETGVESNQLLGNSYELIKRTAKPFPEEMENIYGIKIYSSVDKDYPESKYNDTNQGRDITGDLDYDKKYFWVDAKEAWDKGYKFIYAGREIHFLEEETKVVPHEVSQVKALIKKEGDSFIVIKSNDLNYIVTDSGTTYCKL